MTRTRTRTPGRAAIAALLVVCALSACGARVDSDTSAGPTTSTSSSPEQASPTTASAGAPADGTIPRSRPARAASTTVRDSGGDTPRPPSGEDAEAYAECQRRIESATTSEEIAAAHRWCKEHEPPPPPLASRYERATFEEAAAWWPYRPLLRADVAKLPEPGGRERVFVPGGRQRDPHKETATVMLVYEYETTAEEGTYYEVLEGGGLSVQVIYMPPGTTRGAFPDDSTKPVVVRGHTATMSEMRPPKANVEWRVIRWDEALPNGGTLGWDFGTNPDRYTEAQMIRFVEDLVEVR